jgi:hypothetical protein
VSEPRRITREDIQTVLDGIIKNAISPQDELELDRVLAVMKALLPEGHDWFKCKPCPFCGEAAVVPLPIEGVKKMKAGEHPQNAFPGISAETREMAFTGIHPECWNTLLPREED